jgi:DNA N-6-adenine-methyltransferase (Dam)
MMTLGSHQRTVGKSQVHITPRWVLDRLGSFDLDPAAADPRPWDCAKHSFTVAEDGLSHPWHGRVFLNPPFDRYVVERWVSKLAAHGRGTALLHARTETEWFGPIWQHAAGILFLADRIKFCRSDGTEQPANSGAPAVLVAFGAEDLARLRTCGIAGVLVTEWAHLAGRTRPAANRANKIDDRSPTCLFPNDVKRDSSAR